MPAFLKYGDIKGEVREPAHRSWIELKSASFGVGRSGGSAPNVKEIVVFKEVDSTSPLLHQAALQGNPADAIIDFVDAGGNVYARYEMSETIISSVSSSGGGGDNPVESLTLNFTKIEFKKTPGTPPP
jgi:type VI secretion system secreted protein Hcp